MREITTHKVNECNTALKILVLDDPGPHGASRCYHLTTGTKPLREELKNPAVCVDLTFQDGPIPETGTNGVTLESLLAVVIDRLQGFQRGPFACRENALALVRLEEAMHWLHHRTRDRHARGVEGTYTK